MSLSQVFKVSLLALTLGAGCAMADNKMSPDEEKGVLDRARELRRITDESDELAARDVLDRAQCNLIRANAAKMPDLLEDFTRYVRDLETRKLTEGDRGIYWRSLAANRVTRTLTTLKAPLAKCAADFPPPPEEQAPS